MHHPDVNILTLDIISKFNELNRWCISNKLRINASKTNYILFHNVNKPIPHNFVEMGINTIIKTCSVKITITSKFKDICINEPPLPTDVFEFVNTPISCINTMDTD